MNHNHQFWTHWLEAVCAICIVFGIVLALVPSITPEYDGHIHL